MKTVKRKAEVGEKVLTCHGSIGKVLESLKESIGYTYVNGRGHGRVRHDQYEVIIEDEPKLRPGTGTNTVRCIMPHPFCDVGSEYDVLSKYSEAGEIKEVRIGSVSHNIVVKGDDLKRFEWVEDEPEIPPHSSHYHPGSIDVIRFAEENFSVEERRGFYRMSALKYLTRFDRKGSPGDDLEKAQFYTGKLMDLENEGRTKVTLTVDGNVTEEFYEEGAE